MADNERIHSIVSRLQAATRAVLLHQGAADSIDKVRSIECTLTVGGKSMTVPSDMAKGFALSLRDRAMAERDKALDDLDDAVKGDS